MERDKENVRRMITDKIFNEDCFATIDRLIDAEQRVDCILTSPPYNMTKRKGEYAENRVNGLL